ncbi:hypothetical protein CDL12_21915 [Handroanthus impetiginosus]|uniref:Uncharacterized protein n=1 Tax=Handroanthus impetiginosus TaxID=429701 RepID=A0A2G9GJT5_9LAMI|nr:hypothetical protein CDL12_21915 [Handroanthus impetiginosus]
MQFTTLYKGSSKLITLNAIKLFLPFFGLATVYPLFFFYQISVVHRSKFLLNIAKFFFVHFLIRLHGMPLVTKQRRNAHLSLSPNQLLARALNE